MRPNPSGGDDDPQWWQDVQFWRRFHLARIAVWIVLLPVALATGLKDSVPFLVALSIIAPLLSDVAAWQGARAEESADDAETIANAVLDHLREAGAIE